MPITLEKASPEICSKVEGLEYTMTVADASMRWELSGTGKDITYTTSFLKEGEELFMEYETFKDGFYLYVPRLSQGKQLSDYPLEITRDIQDERYEEPVKADFYNIKKVDVDLLVKTDKGYACFLAACSSNFKAPAAMWCITIRTTSYISKAVLKKQVCRRARVCAALM
ncbi:MAG: hypothetical protein ACLTDX_02300 [[Clostridium] innocuum]